MQYIDISVFNAAPGAIDWPVYKAWSAQGDGRSRLAIKATEGVGFTDGHYAGYRADALANGIDELIYYHFPRPDLGNGAIAEANWCAQVLGSIRPGDLVMLDVESPPTGAWNTPTQWVLDWLVSMQQRGYHPVVYASLSFAEEHLQDTRLAAYPLVLADWTFNASSRPACPPPWSSYIALQYTDQDVVPGVPGEVDTNIFLGGEIMSSNVPAGWTDDGTTLTALNGHKIVLGFREWVLSHSWDASNQPLEEEWHASPLEFSNLDLGDGQKQGFNQTTLEWTPVRGVFEAWQGQEIIALRNALAKATVPPPPAPNIADALTQLEAASTALASAIHDLKQ